MTAIDEKLKVLHICSYFIGSQVYANLFNSIHQLNEWQQYIYVPVRNELHIGKNAEHLDEKLEIKYSNIMNISDRLFFYKKVKKAFLDLVKNRTELLKNSNLVHAHTLFSDGAVANEIYKKYKVPYLLTVRNTDLNYFYKYCLHLRPLFLEIVSNAEKVIFLSGGYKQQLLANVTNNTIRGRLEDADIIPNGIDRYWLNSPPGHVEKIKRPMRLLFVGRLDNNKNILRLIRACNELNAEGESVSLTIAGDGPLFEKIQTMTAPLVSIEMVGEISSVEVLKQHYRDAHLVIVPSLSESFGLVYAEALSQKTPVVFSRQQGFDGWFPDGHCGYAVDPRSVADIMKKIILVRDNYSTLVENSLGASSRFDWGIVASEYSKQYAGVLNRSPRD